MKLTRKEFLKTLCAIPFMAYALPKKENITFDHNIVEFKEDLDSTLLFCPDELKVKARELMSSYYIGDPVCLDSNGKLTHLKRRDEPIFGVVTGIGSDGLVEVEVSRSIRRGHE